MRVVRVNAVLIVIGTVALVAVVYGAFSAFAAYQSTQVRYLKEYVIAQQISGGFGRGLLQYCGPEWVPESLRRSLPYLHRIRRLGFSHRNGDADLRILTGLSSLESLELGCSPVTDAGAGCLASIPTLKLLDCRGTNISREMRSMLRKALPNCKITPDP